MNSPLATSIFVIDDDQSLAKGVAKGLELDGYPCQLFYSAEGALNQAKITPPAAVVSDIQLPGVNGIELVESLLSEYPHLPIILTTAFGSTDVAIEATRAGAYDFLEKPFKIAELSELIRKALDSFNLSRTEIDLTNGKKPLRQSIIGNSQIMREICKTIGRVAATDMSVLIGGETGTGKELVAQALFHYSTRPNQPFLSVNCLSIPDNLIESELFGHEKGAFTGAIARRIGRFEQVKSGTLFLDEIGDLPMTTQGKLLRVLQEGVIQRVGNNQDIPIETRVIAATHKNLKEAIHKGEFREDLYYRLSAMEITLPPLRNRQEDISELVQYFLARYSHQFNTAPPSISRSALKAMQTHYWPGNIRELQNVVQKSIIACRGLPISREIIDQCMPPASTGKTTADIDSWIQQELDQGGEHLLDRLVGECEAKILELALRQVNGNKKELAALLGCSRPTIYQKLKQHHLFASKNEKPLVSRHL